MITLRTQLYQSNMKKEDTIASYFMKPSKIEDQLQEAGEKISDSELITVAIHALPNRRDKPLFIEVVHSSKGHQSHSEICKQERRQGRTKTRQEKGLQGQQRKEEGQRRCGLFSRAEKQSHMRRNKDNLRPDQQ